MIACRISDLGKEGGHFICTARALAAAYDLLIDLGGDSLADRAAIQGDFVASCAIGLEWCVCGEGDNNRTKDGAKIKKRSGHKMGNVYEPNGGHQMGTCCELYAFRLSQSVCG